MDEVFFDYETYIEKRLKEIDDLDERRYAKELLLDGLGRIFRQAESQYKALEKRVLRELDVPWGKFYTFMTIVEKKDFDPINSFWFPICEEDIKKGRHQECETFYLMADERKRQEFFQQETIGGVEEESGRCIRFQIKKACKYEEAVKKLYALFANNHIPWQTIHMGHLERFFELVPMEEPVKDGRIILQWGRWETYVKTGMIPLWNIQREAAGSREFRVPCIDEVFYEHIFYLPDEKQAQDGYLAETREDILSVRYEENRILLKTRKDTLKNVYIYRLHQGSPVMSVGYRYPVLSNQRRDNLAARYLQQTGNFLQTPMELHRKIGELAGGYEIDVSEFKIMDHTAVEVIEGEALTGDMNGFAGAQVFSGDHRSVLLFKIRRKEQRQADYLYESQIRYILSQIQMEFMEYRCVGEVENNIKYEAIEN